MRAWAVIGLGLGVALVGRPHARDHRGDDAGLALVRPDPAVLRIVSLGRPTLAASLLWMHTVARFAETTTTWEGGEDPFSGEPDAADPDTVDWIRAAVLTCGELDPRWTAPWVYGALMLGHLDDVGGEEEVLQAAILARPDEPWFPFTLGTVRYVHHNDLDGAIHWVEQAAAIDGADPAYQRALEGLRARRDR